MLPLKILLAALAAFTAGVLAPGAALSETIEQAWEVALAADHRLQASYSREQAAHWQLSAVQASRLPSLITSGAYKLRDNEPAFRFQSAVLPAISGTFPFMQNEDFSFQTVVKLPLYTGGEISRTIEAAQLSEDAASFGSARHQLEIKMNVARQYITVMHADRLASVADSNVRSLAAHERDTRKRYENRMVSQNDLLATQVVRSNAQQRAIAARNSLQKAYAAYNRLLGRPLESPVQLDALRIHKLNRDLPKLTADALRLRPELARFSVQAEALLHQAASIRAGRRPRVELQGGYTFQENRFQRPEGITSAAVTVQWNIYDGGQREHKARALTLQAIELRHLRAEKKAIIALNVRRAWLDIQEADQRLRVTDEALAQADENSRVARIRYAAGIGTNTEVLDAEALRVQSYVNRDVAFYDAVLVAIRMRYIVGDL